MRSLSADSPHGAAQEVIQIQLPLKTGNLFRRCLAPVEFGNSGYPKASRVDARKRRDHVLGQSGGEIGFSLPREIVDRSDRNADALFGRSRFAAACLLDLPNEAITEARQGLDVLRVFGAIVQGQADLPDAEVKTLLEVDERIIAPDGQADLFARHQGTAMIEQKRKNARWLLLNFGQHAVLAELKRLLVELIISKQDG